ncbi:hypothetical protein [Natronosalvus halobius]|uniref:hypothetical protein n=1 Tax=Natronosalvus halobius TaxID=2953746 RepID=UPI0020A1EB26|nr:hypothetical protein [Natronosalvus halobius]USZ73777.1 hypothetical protein NGM15_18395 [Natronosalvus halobius]
MSNDPLLEECPDCEGTDLEPADEINEIMWDDTMTACHDCKLVFDARGRTQGGFDSEVARELHSAAVDALLDSLGGDDGE